MQIPESGASESQTFLPSYNELLRLTEAYRHGHEQIRPLEEMLDRVEYELEQMLHYFNYEIRFQPPSALVDEVVPQVYGGFESLRTSIPDLRKALAAESLDYFQEQLQGRVKERMHRLFEGLSRLREAERERTPLSPSPAVDLVLRAGRAYLQGTLGAELFLERVQSLISYQQGFLSALDAVRPAPHEQGVLKQHETVVESAFDLQLEALSELERQLLAEALEPGMIEDSLEIVRASTERLFEIQKALSEASEEVPSKLCFRCGCENDSAARFCSQCDALFPPFAASEGPEQPSVTINEQGQIEEEALPENFRRLIEAVEGALTYRLTAGELREEWLAASGRAGLVRRQLAALPPDSGAHPRFAEVRHRMQEGLERLEQALEQIELYLQSEEPQRLQAALNHLVPAADLMVQASSLAEAAVREAR